MDYIGKLLNLVYPNICGVCGRINRLSVCNECSVKINQHIKSKIEKTQNNIEYLHLFKYGGILREKMILYKFHENAYLYKMFAEIAIKDEITRNFLNKYDIIIPVPIHKKRKKTRGYNQSELIAKEIARDTKINILTNVLIKQKNNISQSTLKKQERIENVKDVYALKSSDSIKDKRVVIFDDIYTTGSTVNECIKVLKQAHPREIGIFTLAKD